MAAAPCQSPPVAKLFHIIAFGVYSFCIYYSINFVQIPNKNPRYAIAGKAKYLTQWNLVLQGFYFGYCVFLDVIPIKILRRFRDVLFSSISLPLCLFVFIIFWGLYSIDRELIFPRAIEPFYPNWLNHGSHTIIVPFAVLEALLYEHKQPSTFVGMTALLTWFVVYLVWVMYLGVVHAVWVYPVMEVLTAPLLALFFFSCFLIVALLYNVARFINTLRFKSSQEKKYTKSQ